MAWGGAGGGGGEGVGGGAPGVASDAMARGAAVAERRPQADHETCSRGAGEGERCRERVQGGGHKPADEAAPCQQASKEQTPPQTGVSSKEAPASNLVSGHSKLGSAITTDCFEAALVSFRGEGFTQDGQGSWLLIVSSQTA